MLAILSTDHLEVIDDTFGTGWCTRTLCQLALMVDVPNDVTALSVLKKMLELSFRVTCTGRRVSEVGFR